MYFLNVAEKVVAICIHSPDVALQSTLKLQKRPQKLPYVHQTFLKALIDCRIRMSIIKLNLFYTLYGPFKVDVNEGFAVQPADITLH